MKKNESHEATLQTIALIRIFELKQAQIEQGKVKTI